MEVIHLQKFYRRARNIQENMYLDLRNVLIPHVLKTNILILDYILQQ